MTERSDSSPRRLSLVNPFSGAAAARAPTPTPPYSRNVTPPAYGVFAPHTMAAPYTYAVPQPELSPSYHYVPVPCAGVWPQPQHPTGVPLVAAVELAGLYRPSSPLAAQPLPPSAFVRKETLASVARCSNSSPRSRSTGRSDKPYMLQKCGPFFTWQLLIMWMAVLGTVVFVCSFGAFRHYLGERALEAVYLNASCSFRNPCRGVGFFCVGGRCVCGPDYEVQGELCGLKRNAVTDDPVVTIPDVSVPLTSTRGARSASNSGRPDPRKGIHERHSLDKELLHAQTTSFEDDDDFTFVIATFQYEDRVNKHVAPIRSTAVARDDAVRHPVRNRPTKTRTRKKFKMN
ncbi:uncharacterized protein LOC142778410 isoform X2 [Rhipicephalus microplus]|uniref:uncharacterized protein LOC142778410 isoform X2 n=1 Tax=Rhipicephalus microplus TaxID=6941 RepID=UPI003F6CA381